MNHFLNEPKIGKVYLLSGKTLHVNQSILGSQFSSHLRILCTNMQELLGLRV